MVLGIAMMATMLPTMIGLNQASQHMRDSEDNRKESSRKQRCHLLVNCSVNQGTTEQREQIHNAMVYVGPENRLYITKNPNHNTMTPFNGGFFTHPQFPPDNTAGLVTITGETPPTLRWVFLDVTTHEVCWGGRAESEGQVCGPFDWTKDESRMTLEGWEGWLAVRFPGVDDEGVWRLWFDREDNGAGLREMGREVLGLEVVLRRVAAES
ncbi:uncharacterized protein BO87DRAFT_386426 [Aspergillus neoniger CBS 115656]|uniref:Uncharacterized protein n=1 Tax=Aspergillus neoniger (strain CBS 115656) TaxID=1448310 RepID=A0A318YNX0_ASPNB|nr:hypothetical protein BO87DRAFT_386426 [Aspergillus neoniger CBS 115656]PYH34433.1 hypothetical protein BO87DRAFT_386426 [Aspergillus neoniger CBS 115656]